jgi:hypothetical protein
MKGYSNQMMELTFAPTKTVKGSAVSYTSGVWDVVDREGRASVAKGIYVPSGVNGDIEVHFRDDYIDGAKQYSVLSLTEGSVVPAVFDAIKEDGTTITLTDIIFGLSTNNVI